MKKTLNLYHLTILYLMICAFLFGVQSAGAQEVHSLKYIATKNGETIGWLRTNYIQKGEEKWLTTESNLELQVLISFKAIALTCNRFNTNILEQAAVTRTLNGRAKLDNLLKLEGNKYVTIKGNPEVSIQKPIVNTVASIYFKEPVGITEIFSEVYLRFITLKKLSASTYNTSLPDGGTMTYTYSNGMLTEIIASTNYGTIYFKLQ